jgi:hypothetical protein
MRPILPEELPLLRATERFRAQQAARKAKLAEKERKGIGDD